MIAAPRQHFRNSANEYLEEQYLPEHNRRFERAAAKPEGYHWRKPTARELREGFQLEAEHTISKEWVLRHEGRYLQLKPAAGTMGAQEARLWSANGRTGRVRGPRKENRQCPDAAFDGYGWRDCLSDNRGHCQFNDLLFRRGEPCFVAFDLLDSGGKDVRHEPLLDRKHELRRIIGSGLPPIIYADHVEGSGVALFEKCCELDLEGIVAKYKHAPYDPVQATWFKIRNRNYSQMAGRERLFEQ